MIGRILAIASLVWLEIRRKKDLYVALVLMGVVLVGAQGLKFYNVDRISRYLADLGFSLACAFSAVISAALTARQFPGEVESRSLPLLMSKPVSRAEYVLGKFAGCAFASIVSFLLFFVALSAAVLLKGGTIDPGAAIQAAAAFSVGLMMLTALTFLLSFWMTTGANLSVTLTVYFMTFLYGKEISERLGFADILWPHFDLFDLKTRLVHGWGPAPVDAVFAILAYGMIYTALLLSLSYGSFRSKTL